MYKFLIVIEKAKKNFSAYCPDLPGCIATGRTKGEVEENMYKAVKLHLEGLEEDRKSIPRSKSFSEYILLN